MRLYKILMEPQSAFATPLKADTLFGVFCWQAAQDRDILTGGLEKWVEVYHQRPFVVFSSAWPCLQDGEGDIYALKRPDLPLSYFFAEKGESRRERLKKRKDNQRRRWMLVGGDLRLDPASAELINDGELAGRLLGSRGEGKAYAGVSAVSHEDERMHNSINRMTMTTGEGFAPFSTPVTHYLPGCRLVIFVLVDEGATDIGRVCRALERVGVGGFGADASTGCGRFKLWSWEEIPLPSCKGGNAAYCLGPVVPEGGSCRMAFFQPFTRFGRHGDWLAVSPDPFKNPVVMADEGAVLVPADPAALGRPYLGRAVSGLSKALPETIHQGYAVHIPFRLELDHV
ncbi:MAG TPA: hypothetical protein PK836_10310 [Syntrophales bacterium]|nr:hypothetical protein [Syntrophales bacterium]HOM08301.1 hypothetical protein [Syntrophales bacterium]HOO00938.1 hypothetical protein [Syntrophales bacterium]HPC02054.1 hypothetical protein [Syntrophales bacterium]